MAIGHAFNVAARVLLRTYTTRKALQLAHCYYIKHAHTFAWSADSNVCTACTLEPTMAPPYCSCLTRSISNHTPNTCIADRCPINTTSAPSASQRSAFERAAPTLTSLAQRQCPQTDPNAWYPFMTHKITTYSILSNLPPFFIHGTTQLPAFVYAEIISSEIVETKWKQKPVVHWSRDSRLSGML